MKSIGSMLAVSMLAFGVATTAMAQMQTLPPYMTADHNMRSSKLIGMTVYNDHNEKLGAVDDILLPTAGGEATAVISVGGFLGAGEKLIKVPVSHVHLAAGKMTMEGDKPKLTAMPKYTYNGGGEG